MYSSVAILVYTLYYNIMLWQGVSCSGDVGYHDKQCGGRGDVPYLLIQLLEQTRFS